MGAYYGQLNKGTPLSIAVTRIDDAFGRTTSNGWGTDTVSGLTWSHTSASVWSTTGSAGYVRDSSRERGGVRAHCRRLRP
jgi:hypothetical protein